MGNKNIKENLKPILIDLCYNQTKGVLFKNAF